MIPREEANRLLADLQGRGITAPVHSGVKIDEDKAEVTSGVTSVLSDPDTLLRERGLDPADWEVTHLKVNEWDGPNGEPLKQLTVNVRKLAHSFFLQPAFVPDDYVAPPKSEPTDQESELVVLVGDQQAPYHDHDLHRVFCDWLAENTPNRGVLMGDTVDFPDISRHPKNPDHDRTVQECLNSGYLLLRDYVQRSENTRWTKIMGNHDERIRTHLLQYAPGLHNIRRADDGAPEAPALSLQHLLRLDALDIEFIDPEGPYTNAQTKISDKLAARHGWLTRKGSGASALGTLEHLGYSVVVGHTHRQSLVHKTTHDIDGTTATLAAAETGCMCRNDGLGYAVAPDWQQGFATATVYPDGTFKLDLATFVNGILYWRDQRYE
jgi:hypothetical protein